MRAGLHRRCQLLRFRPAAAGAGHRHGDLLPGHDHHPAGRRAAAAHSPRRPACRNFARITAGGFAASVVTTLWDRREALHQSRMADLTTIFSPAFNQARDESASAGLARSGREGVDRPHHHRPGLSAGGRRYLLGVGLDLLHPDRHGLALPQGQVGRRCAGCCRLNRLADSTESRATPISGMDRDSVILPNEARRQPPCWR